MLKCISVMLTHVFCMKLGGADNVDEFNDDNNHCPHKKFLWLGTNNPSAKCVVCGFRYYPDEQRWGP